MRLKKGHQETKVCQCYNLRCLPPALVRVTVKRLRGDLPWVALTRQKTLTEEAKARLERVGTNVFTWSKGTIVAASTGAWSMAQVRSISSREMH